MDTQLANWIGTGICLVYAFFWLIVGLNPPPLLHTIFYDPEPTSKDISAWFVGAFLFAAAPAMRGRENAARVLFACGIGAVIWPGLLGAAQGKGSFEERLMWLGIPIAIALWVQIGTSISRARPSVYHRLKSRANASIDSRTLAERMNSEPGGDDRDVKGKAPDWLKRD